MLLLDSRRDPTDDDRAMLEFLAEVGVPTLVAITKTDKFGPRAAEERVRAIRTMLLLDEDQVVSVSARTGAGREELASAMMDLLSQPAWHAH